MRIHNPFSTNQQGEDFLQSLIDLAPDQRDLSSAVGQWRRREGDHLDRVRVRSLLSLEREIKKIADLEQGVLNPAVETIESLCRKCFESPLPIDPRLQELVPDFTEVEAAYLSEDWWNSNDDDCELFLRLLKGWHKNSIDMEMVYYFASVLRPSCFMSVSWDDATPVKAQFVELLLQCPPEDRQSLISHLRSSYESSAGRLLAIARVKLGALKAQKQGNAAARAEIAMECLEWPCEDVAKYMEYFRVADPTALDRPDVVARYRQEREKLYAQEVVKQIKNFGIADQGVLTKMAQICAQRDGVSMIEYISRFGIKDQSARFEIATLCAKGYSYYLCRNISNFGIDNPEYLIAVAKACAVGSRFEPAEALDKLGITDPESLEDIAVHWASQERTDIAAHIADFRITNQEVLTKIALMSARRNGLSTAKHISKFQIESQESLFEIAMACAGQDTMCPSYCYGVSGYIGQFGIRDPARRFQIAKVCAANCHELPFHLEEFKLEGPHDREDIARIHAENQPRFMVKRIGRFGITDQAVLGDIAKVCAAKVPSKTAKKIKNFGITDQSSLIEIAMICAKGKPGKTAANIMRFGITDQSGLIEIAKICAKGNPGNTAANIWKFRIKDQNALCAIARNCACLDGMFTAECIRNFRIVDEAALAYIARLCLNQNMNAICCRLNFGFSLDFLTEFIEKDASSIPFEKYFREILDIADSRVQLQTFDIFFVALLLLPYDMDDQQLDCVEKRGLLRAILQYRRPEMRLSLLACLLTVGCDDNAWKTYADLLPRKEGDLEIFRLMYARLSWEGVPPKNLKLLRNTVEGSSHFFRDSIKYQQLISALITLGRVEGLSGEEKGAILDKAMEDVPLQQRALGQNTFLKNLSCVNSCLLLGAADQLTKSGLSCEGILQQVFRAKVPVGDIEDFATKFSEQLMTTRDPQALFTYAATVKTLEDPEVEECLGRYVASILNGTFQRERYGAFENDEQGNPVYRVFNNPHLETIFGGQPQEFFEKWKLNREYKIDVLVSEEGLAEGSGYETSLEWLKSKLLHDKHLDIEGYSFLKDFLEAPTEEAREKIRISLAKTQAAAAKDKTAEGKGALAVLALQARFLQLAGKTDASEELGVLKGLKKALNKVGLQGTEFMNDVEGRGRDLQELKTVQKPGMDIAVDTDDPIDLLLCGTDVSGSCQRVNGNSNLNKGLLGYLMDGKNRLLAVKGPDGRIKARCLLRMLWDGKQPVLFLEPFYGDCRYWEALKQMAKLKAEALGLPLLSANGEGDKYEAPIISLGGPAPFEYSDACRGVKNRGIFTIDGAKHLFGS